MRVRYKRVTISVVAALACWLSFGLWHLGQNWIRDRAFVDAAGAGDIVAVRAYLDHGMPPDVRGYGGMTALMWSAYYGRTELVRLLLERGADPRSALSQAKIMHHSDVVHMLVAAGEGRKS